MPDTYTGRYEFSTQGRPAGSGPCEFSFDTDSARLAASGAPIAFDLGDIEALAIGDYDVALSLSDGSVLRLSHFARAFQTLVAELREAYRARLVKCLLVSDLDEVARFDASIDGTALTRPYQGRCEVRLYESNVAFLFDSGGGFQWRLSDLDSVVLDQRDYSVLIATVDEAVRVGKLAKRTGELVDRLNSRMLALKDRAARVLHAVLPFVSPAEFQRVSAEMREGACASLSTLQGVQARILPTLLERVVDAELRPYLADLMRRSSGAGYVGWKLIRHVDEGQPDADEASSALDVSETDANTGGPDSQVDAAAATSSRQPALDVGDGLEALFWYFFPIGGVDDAATHLAWETTSREGRATYLFRPPGAASGSLDTALLAVNRALVALNFRRAPVYLADEVLASDVRYRHYAIAARRLADLRDMRRWFAGRAIHTSVEGWGQQLDRVLRQSHGMETS